MTNLVNIKITINIGRFSGKKGVIRLCVPHDIFIEDFLLVITIHDILIYISEFLINIVYSLLISIIVFQTVYEAKSTENFGTGALLYKLL